MSLEDICFSVNPQIQAVVIGQDTHFSYKKILLAATYLREPEVPFVATDHEGRHPYMVAKTVEPGKCLVTLIIQSLLSAGLCGGGRIRSQPQYEKAHEGRHVLAGRDDALYCDQYGQLLAGQRVKICDSRSVGLGR